MNDDLKVDDGDFKKPKRVPKKVKFSVEDYNVNNTSKPPLPKRARRFEKRDEDQNQPGKGGKGKHQLGTENEGQEQPSETDKVKEMQEKLTKEFNEALARMAAENAKMAAENAKIAAENAKIAAESAQKDGVIAVISAESAKIAAESAKIAAESAQKDGVIADFQSKSIFSPECHSTRWPYLPIETHNLLFISHSLSILTSLSFFFSQNASSTKFPACVFFIVPLVLLAPMHFRDLHVKVISLNTTPLFRRRSSSSQSIQRSGPTRESSVRIVPMKPRL